MAALPLTAAAQLRSYSDGDNGVSFAYPAHWLLNGDDDAATAKLRIVGKAPPLAVVQLEGNFEDKGPYKGTDFEAGAFAYTVLSGGDPTQCLASLEPMGDAKQRPAAVTWKGLQARRLEATFGIAGTLDMHEIVAVYQGGQCYLLESVIVSKTADSVKRPLSQQQWRLLRGQFHAVLQSVRLTPAPGRP